MPHELESWLEEKQSSYLYRLVSDAESGTPRQLLFLELARAADTQADLWVAEMKKTGITLPGPYSPDRRTRIVGRLVKWLGPRRMRPVLAAMKVRGMSLYTKAAVAPSPQYPVDDDIRMPVRRDARAVCSA